MADTIVPMGPRLGSDAGVEDQRRYHRALFPRLLGSLVLDDADGINGLDQMGHFGSAGCELVADALRAVLPPTGQPRLVELGAGVGGAAADIARRLDGPVTVAGVELVTEVSRLGRRDASYQPLVATAAALPLGSSCADAVYAAGSFSHFADASLVLREAARICRPTGIVVLLEEVSIVTSTPTDEFLRWHPAGVFHLASVATRRQQLEAAGLEAELTDLSVWARTQLRKRLRAMRLHRDRLCSFMGSDAFGAVCSTMEAASAEIERGTVVPTLVVARPRPEER